MNLLELFEAIDLIIAAPLIGAAILVIVFLVFKPEEQRITEDLKMFSSKGTYLLKRKMPLFACPIIAVIATVFAIKTFPNSPPELKIVASILMGIIFLAPFACFTLKEVGIGRDYLYVSNLTSSIRVPFTDIDKIWARDTGRSGWYIFISFKNKTRYGRKIYFLPYKSEKVLMDGAEHPVVVELKNEILKRTSPMTH
jgi:hypothetical protein